MSTPSHPTIPIASSDEAATAPPQKQVVVPAISLPLEDTNPQPSHQQPSKISINNNRSSSSLHSHFMGHGSSNHQPHTFSRLFKKSSDRSAANSPPNSLNLTPHTSNAPLLTPKMSNQSDYSACESSDSNTAGSHHKGTSGASHSSRRLKLKRFFKNTGANNPILPQHRLKEQHEQLHNVINTKLNKLKIGGHNHSSSGTALSRLFKKDSAGDSFKSKNNKMGGSSSSSTSPKHGSFTPLKVPNTAEEPEDTDAIMNNLVSNYGMLPDKNSEKYLLGEGAGGSVLIVKRPSDNHVFAIKKFRPQNARETDYDYRKKVQNEYMLMARLDHQNIVRAYELLNDKSLYVLVMEYCPFDFFTIVMGGVMSKLEIYCYFKQMVRGVEYLHSQGIAHRDLKLDNCVVNKHGILKICDFGSAVFFLPQDSASPSSNSIKLKNTYDSSASLITSETEATAASTSSNSSVSIIKARGVVGSDPYLAPECLGMSTYDPRPADVWSLAIMFCCMVMRRFPWKIPKSTDQSFKSFTSVPSDTIDENGRKRITGPNKLLRLLPSASREIIGDMLELKPESRVDMESLLRSPFVTEISSCYVNGVDAEGEEVVHRSEGHKHHLITEEDLERIDEEKRKQLELANGTTA